MRVGLISLGCPKNRVDSEVILGMLGSCGFQVGGADETCDAIIVNTCAFIEDAKVEAMQEILEALEMKAARPDMRVYAAGCLPQRYPLELGAELSDLDGIYGVDELEKLVHDVARDLASVISTPRKPKLVVDTALKPSWLYDHTHPRLLTTLPHYAYVKISEGCDHRCAFCTIPSIKGPFRSREVSSVVSEVNTLAQMGVKEVNLVSQDTTAFGSDTGSSLHKLLTELDKLPGPPWIRLLYMHPEKLDDELLGIIKSSNRILNYIDMPLQHVSGNILERMRRTAPSRRYLDLVANIRDFFGENNVCLRTTLIVGFPGETDDEFAQLADFVEDAQFDRLTVFKFSRELGTEAWDMPDQVEDYEIDHRYHTLMNIQADVSFGRNSSYIGAIMKVLAESIGDDQIGDGPDTRSTDTCISRQVNQACPQFVGRSFRDAPEVDGMVYIQGQAEIGEFVDVEITEAMDYDLVGKVL